MAGEEEKEHEESFKLLGILDVQKTPCARESVLYGSFGSVMAGLGYFLATSRVKRSFDVGVGGFLLTTLGIWCHCRYNNAKQRMKKKLIQEGLKNKIIYEGTNFDPMLKRGGSGAEPGS
ncbi:cytochrome c oxidase assembly protein COX20, mitochondrial [Erpetoichthys calabaricus]|uniref:Cytochrome c oxidase assembly protein COX20, mitochondrial n=1 Tax=Erpetoichthys calabaricus TaxID=27687 RepID=A0A8C4TLP9_ERPCA|nr:cytochrome c oxidase assembly protein COX20, mitochondrial [Erpetoichthys calabaricus]